jgi:small-conductance mechanosensitive channel
METVKDFFSDPMSYTLLGNDVVQWSVAVIFGIASYIVLGIIRNRIITRVSAFAERTGTKVGRLAATILSGIKPFLLVAGAVLIASQFLELGAAAARGLRLVLIVAAAGQVAVWSHRLVDFLIHGYLERHKGPDGKPDGALATTMGAVKFIGLLVLYLLIALLAAENMGIDVKALIAGLGIGGIAIALAVQNILGDLFSSLSIVMDKPFVLGDFIVVGDKMGTVERIGLKTTRLRALSGEQLVFTNTDLLTSRIQNFKRMAERRVTITLGVSYDTALEKLERIPGMIREIVSGHQQIRFDRSHFSAFGNSTLDFETVYYVLTADVATHMDAQQAILLEIHRRFAREGIEFAYPTQTVHVRMAAGAPGAIADRASAHA